MTVLNQTQKLLKGKKRKNVVKIINLKGIIIIFNIILIEVKNNYKIYFYFFITLYFLINKL